MWQIVTHTYGFVLSATDMTKRDISYTELEFVRRHKNYVIWHDSVRDVLSKIVQLGLIGIV